MNNENRTGGQRGNTEQEDGRQEGWNPDQLRSALEGVPKDRYQEARDLTDEVGRQLNERGHMPHGGTSQR